MTRRRAQSQSTFAVVEIPFTMDWDNQEIPTDVKAACSKCTCNKAIFLVLPCGDYGFCKECLEHKERKCRDLDVKIRCIACEVEVEEYVKYYRATMINNQPST